MHCLVLWNKDSVPKNDYAIQICFAKQIFKKITKALVLLKIDGEVEYYRSKIQQNRKDEFSQKTQSINLSNGVHFRGKSVPVAKSQLVLERVSLTERKPSMYLLPIPLTVDDTKTTGTRSLVCPIAPRASKSRPTCSRWKKSVTLRRLEKVRADDTKG